MKYNINNYIYNIRALKLKTKGIEYLNNGKKSVISLTTYSRYVKRMKKKLTQTFKTHLMEYGEF